MRLSHEKALAEERADEEAAACDKVQRALASQLASKQADLEVTRRALESFQAWMSMEFICMLFIL